MALWTTHVKYIWTKDTRFILDIIQGLLHIKEHRVLSIHQYEVGEVWRCRFAEIEKGENLSSLLWPCLTEAETHSVGGFLVNASYEAAEATTNQSLVDQSPFQKRQWVLNACPVSVTCLFVKLLSRELQSWTAKWNSSKSMRALCGEFCSDCASLAAIQPPSTA